VCHREAYRYEAIDENRRFFRDEWGIVVRLEGEVMPSPVGHPIRSEGDFEKLVPPDPCDPFRLRRLAAAVERYAKRKPVVLGMTDAFSLPWKLRGMDNFLVDLLDNPGFAKRIIGAVVDYNSRLIQRAADIGVDIVRLTDDYAFNGGPFMAPEMWVEFIQPGLRQLVEVAHGLGLKVVKHSCGRLDGLAEAILDTGVDALHPIQPLPGQTLGEFKLRFGSRVCLVGNVDCIEVLASPSREVVIEDVRRCLREGAANGGYMLASSNAFHSGTRPENLGVMVEAARALGTY
jgi:uroporphyrinogen decarboxylase